MGDSLWDKAKNIWGLEGKSEITNPESSDNENIANAIIDFQEAAHKITDILAEKSFSYEAYGDSLITYKNAITLAYVAALNGQIAQVIKILKEVVD